MPRYLDNYRLQKMDEYILDNSKSFFMPVEHYSAKQTNSEQKYILKRFKLNPNGNTKNPNPKTLSIEEQELFDKLTHETLILKKLDNKSIPKCLRILKTSNSIYFVFQDYPLNSIKKNVEKFNFTPQQKINIASQLIDTLIYIHQKNIVHKAISFDHIHIDANNNVYLTNFKHAQFFDLQSTNLKSLEIIRKEKQLRSLQKQDILDLAKLLYQLFQFDKILPQSLSVCDSCEINIYKKLQQILNRNIYPNTLEVLLKIINEKQNLRKTASTQSPQSPRSPCLSRLKIKRTFTNTSIQSHVRPIRNSLSRFQLSLKSSQIQQTNQSPKRLPKESITSIASLNSSRSKQLPNQSRFTTSRILSQKTQKIQILSTTTSLNDQKIEKEQQDQKKKNKTFMEIIKSRKLSEFVFYCMKQVPIHKNINLMTILILKAQKILQQSTKNLLSFKNYPQKSKKEKQFLEITQIENESTLKCINVLKQSLLQMGNFSSEDQNYPLNSIDQFSILDKNLSLEDNLSKQIHYFVENQLGELNKESQLTGIMEKDKSKQNTQTLSQTNSMQTAQLQNFSPSLSQTITPCYQKLKLLYYMSIKLKYHSLQNFYDKKIHPYSLQFSIFKDDYFQPFESQQIPMHKLVEQIVIRTDKFSKKSSSESIQPK